MSVNVTFVSKRVFSLANLYRKPLRPTSLANRVKGDESPRTGTILSRGVQGRTGRAPRSPSSQRPPTASGGTSQEEHRIRAGSPACAPPTRLLRPRRQPTSRGAPCATARVQRQQGQQPPERRCMRNDSTRSTHTARSKKGWERAPHPAPQPREGCLHRLRLLRVQPQVPGCGGDA